MMNDTFPVIFKHRALVVIFKHYDYKINMKGEDTNSTRQDVKWNTFFHEFMSVSTFQCPKHS